MKDYPGWWKAFYESKPQNKYFGQTWSLLLPRTPRPLVSDDRPWTTKYKDLGTRFPHPIVGGAKEPSKAYYDAMMWSAFGDLADVRLRQGGHRGRESRQQSRRRPRHPRYQLDQS